MLHILGLFFIGILIVLILGLTIIAAFIRNLFGLAKRTSPKNDTRHTTNPSKEQWASTEEGEIHPKRKKIFSKEDGEYVDFEEIKTNE